MNTEQLREHIENLVNQRWEDFAREHPRLAAAIDRTALVDQSIAALADDPEYQKAMADSQLAGETAERLLELAQRVVGVILRRL